MGIKSRAGRMGTAHAERKGRGGARSKEKGFPYPFSENEVRHCGMRVGCGGGGGSVPRSPSIPTLPAGAWQSRKRASSKGGGLGREWRAHPQRRNSTKFQGSLDKVAFFSRRVCCPVWTNGPPICTVLCTRHFLHNRIASHVKKSALPRGVCQTKLSRCCIGGGRSLEERRSWKSSTFSSPPRRTVGPQTSKT